MPDVTADATEFPRLYSGRLWLVLAWDQSTALWQRIVYADDLENPRLINICDPDKRGSSCGSSKNPPLPGWIMSRLPPRRHPCRRSRAGEPETLVAGFARR